MTQDLTDWTPRPQPSNAPITGRYIDIQPWNRNHGEALWQAFGGADANELLWHFGWPQMNAWQDLADILDGFNDPGDFITCIFCDKQTGAALGMASYLRIDCNNGVVETGAIGHGPALQKTPAATEAHYLMARRVFDEFGYRRYEWKLNNPNEASHQAAQRFGFTYEGVFRQHMVMRYGNRDTAWYSILDSEWPLVKRAFEAWLEPSNFDDQGQQKLTLQAIRENLQQGQET